MFIKIAVKKCILYNIKWKSVQNYVNNDFNYVKYTAVIIESRGRGNEGISRQSGVKKTPKLNDNKILDCVNTTSDFRCWLPMSVSLTLLKEYYNEKIKINPV